MPMIAKAKARAGSVRQSLGLTTHRAHEPTDARAGGAVISVPDLGMALNDDLGTPKPPLAIGNSGDTDRLKLKINEKQSVSGRSGMTERTAIT